MSASFSDILINVAQLIGLLVLAWMAICVIVLMGATVKFAVVTWELSNKAANARHISSQDVFEENQLDNSKFFAQINEDTKDEDWRKTYQPREEYLNTGSIEFRNPTPVTDDQRASFAAHYEPSASHESPTMVQPAFDDSTQVYEPVVINSTPPDGVLFLNGEAKLNPELDLDGHPFNLEDSRGPATQPH